MKPNNLRFESEWSGIGLVDPHLTQHVIWDIVDKKGKVLVKDLVTSGEVVLSEEDLAIEMQKIIESYQEDTL